MEEAGPGFKEVVGRLQFFCMTETKRGNTTTQILGKPALSSIFRNMTTRMNEDALQVRLHEIAEIRAFEYLLSSENQQLA
eukprot:1907044-Prorocentrum_lima.AAC.1